MLNQIFDSDLNSFEKMFLAPKNKTRLVPVHVHCGTNARYVFSKGQALYRSSSAGLVVAMNSACFVTSASAILL